MRQKEEKKFLFFKGEQVFLIQEIIKSQENQESEMRSGSELDSLGSGLHLDDKIE